MKILSVKLLMAVFLSTLVSAFAYAEDEISDKTNKVEYIDLLMGGIENKSYTGLPSGVTFEGDFRKVVGAGWDAANGKIQFRPKKTGVGTMLIVDGSKNVIKEIRITVTENNLSKVAREVSNLLGTIEGINVKIINSKVIVDGEVMLPRDMNRIVSVLKNYQGQTSNLVTISPLAEKKIAEYIEKDINNPEIHCRSVNGKFILEGWAGDGQEKSKAEVIAKTYVPDEVVEDCVALGKCNKPKLFSVINLINVKEGKAAEPGKIVRMTVHYVELQKDYEKSFRFQWMPDLDDGAKLEFGAGDRSPGASLVSSITGTISNLLPKLNWAKQHGFARVLQSSSLLVVDGQKGDIRSTIRIPYLVAGPQGVQSTNFEEAGMITTITPKVTGARSDSVRLQMDFSVKSLLGITSKGPLISNSQIQTVVVVRSTQSAAVGGLVQASTGTDFNKLPAEVSKNPIISLYASKSFRRNQSQFVVFVTPQIQSSASEGAEQIKQKFRLRD